MRHVYFLWTDDPAPMARPADDPALAGCTDPEATAGDSGRPIHEPRGPEWNRLIPTARGCARSRPMLTDCRAAAAASV